MRLVLTDLRRTDITATAPAGGEQSPAAAVQNQSPSDPIAELIGTFQFEEMAAAYPPRKTASTVSLAARAPLGVIPPEGQVHAVASARRTGP